MSNESNCCKFLEEPRTLSKHVLREIQLKYSTLWFYLIFLKFIFKKQSSFARKIRVKTAEFAGKQLGKITSACVKKNSSGLIANVSNRI